MISTMIDDQKKTIEDELQMLEKLHRLGDDEGARIIARRLLISQTLDDDEKRRINRVINAEKIKAFHLIVIVLTIIVFIYIYLRSVN